MRVPSSLLPVVESVTSLSVLNLLNMALPLVTLPYLIRVVGLANYGRYAVVYAMAQYVVLVSTYGFNFSATRQVSVSRANQSSLDHILSAVLASKALLSVLPSLFFVSLSAFFFRGDYLLMMVFGLGIVVGDILNPVWLYQGLEKMRYLTIVTFVSQLLFTVLIFVLVRRPSDYIYIIMYNSAGYLVAGIVSLCIACRVVGVSLRWPSWAAVACQLKDGFYLFLSTLFMNLYRNSNTFVLGLFVDERLVGMYAGAEKVVKAVQSMANPVSAAFFPHMADAFRHHSLRQNIVSLRRLAVVVGGLLLVLMLLCVAFAPWLNSLLLGAQAAGGTRLIRLLSPVILVGGLNYVLGIVGLVNLGARKTFLYIVAVSGTLSLVLLVLTVSRWGVESAVSSMLTAELLIFVCCVFYLLRLYGGHYRC